MNEMKTSGNEQEWHLAGKVAALHKGLHEGYRRIFPECREADVVYRNGPEDLPYCVAIEFQTEAKHTDVNVIRDFGNGAEWVGIVTPNEAINKRVAALLERRVDAELLKRVFVVTLEDFIRQPLSELIGKGEDQYGDDD